MKKGTRKMSAVLLAVVLVAACAVGGTLAWVATHTNSVVNTFVPGEVTSKVVETVDGDTKSDVKIQNTGNVDAYIRATVVINLVDNDGNVSATSPEGKYTITGNYPGSSWFQKDGYYYYTDKVAAGATTGNLMNSIEPTASLPDGLHLQVSILAEAIQADGTDGSSTPAVTDAWGVTVSNGQLSES